MRDAGVVQPLRTLTFSHPNPVETSPGSTSVVTTEPATGQVYVTIDSSYFATLPAGVVSNIWCAEIIFSCRNTSGASRTLNYKSLLNGSTVATGSRSVSNNNWLALSVPLSNVAVNDEVELRVWASSTGVNYDYYAVGVRPSRLFLLTTESGRVTALLNRLFVAGAWSLSPPTTSFGSVTTGGFSYCFGSHDSLTTYTNRVSIIQHATYGFVRLGLGDESSDIVANVSGTNRSTVQTLPQFTSIELYPVEY